MLTIWKYPVLVQDEFMADMPEGAVVLSAALQYGEPVMWARVDTAAPKRQRLFAVIGTGNPMLTDVANWRFVGTFQLFGGGFIGHLFDCGE